MLIFIIREEIEVRDKAYSEVETANHELKTAKQNLEDYCRDLEGKVWSRRLTQEHRLVYLVRDHRIDFLQCRYHY